jgi:hypothetical protein
MPAPLFAMSWRSADRPVKFCRISIETGKQQAGRHREHGPTAHKVGKKSDRDEQGDIRQALAGAIDRRHSRPPLSRCRQLPEEELSVGDQEWSRWPQVRRQRQPQYRASDHHKAGRGQRRAAVPTSEKPCARSNRHQSAHRDHKPDRVHEGGCGVFQPARTVAIQHQPGWSRSTAISSSKPSSPPHDSGPARSGRF